MSHDLIELVAHRPRGLQASSHQCRRSTRYALRVASFVAGSDLGPSWPSWHAAMSWDSVGA